jgi:hypothetical protein
MFFVGYALNTNLIMSVHVTCTLRMRLYIYIFFKYFRTASKVIRA